MRRVWAERSPLYREIVEYIQRKTYIFDYVARILP